MECIGVERRSLLVTAPLRPVYTYSWFLFGRYLLTLLGLYFSSHFLTIRSSREPVPGHVGNRFPDSRSPGSCEALYVIPVIRQAAAHSRHWFDQVLERFGRGVVELAGEAK